MARRKTTNKIKNINKLINKIQINLGEIEKKKKRTYKRKRITPVIAEKEMSLLAQELRAQQEGHRNIINPVAGVTNKEIQKARQSYQPEAQYGYVQNTDLANKISALTAEIRKSQESVKPKIVVPPASIPVPIIMPPTTPVPPIIRLPRGIRPTPVVSPAPVVPAAPVAPPATVLPVRVPTVRRTPRIPLVPLAPRLPVVPPVPVVSITPPTIIAPTSPRVIPPAPRVPSVRARERLVRIPRDNTLAPNGIRRLRRRSVDLTEPLISPKPQGLEIPVITPISLGPVPVSSRQQIPRPIQERIEILSNIDRTVQQIERELPRVSPQTRREVQRVEADILDDITTSSREYPIVLYGERMQEPLFIPTSATTRIPTVPRRSRTEIPIEEPLFIPASQQVVTRIPTVPRRSRRTELPPFEDVLLFDQVDDVNDIVDITERIDEEVRHVSPELRREVEKVEEDIIDDVVGTVREYPITLYNPYLREPSSPHMEVGTPQIVAQQLSKMREKEKKRKEQQEMRDALDYIYSEREIPVPEPIEESSEILEEHARQLHDLEEINKEIDRISEGIKAIESREKYPMKRGKNTEVGKQYRELTSKLRNLKVQQKHFEELVAS